MNVNKISGFYSNKLLKKGLEFAADNGALFAAGTTLALSLAVRPLSIFATPKTDKENKKIACAKSLASSLTGYFMMLAFSKPVSNAIKNIDKSPKQFLSENTIKNLQNGAKSLPKSKAYILATQMLKLGLGILIAVPKATLTSLLLPVFVKNKEENVPKKNTLSFTGLPDKIGKLINQKWYQNFAKKYQDTNFPMHIIATTDALTTATFITQIKNSKKVSDERKKPLIFNSAISTGLSIICGYTVDKLLDKPTEKFIAKFKEANKTSPKLDKYVQGIKIAKPILILGGIYYAIIPSVSTFLADRIGIKDE